MMNHPLELLTQERRAIQDELVRKTVASIANDQTELVLNDAIFHEKKRLEERTDPIRDTLDQSFWRDISSQFKKGVELSHEAKTGLITKIVSYHADEILGNFNPMVYKLATKAVPKGLSWLLQAMTWKSFSNLFADRVDLRRKVHLQGETTLLKKLSQKGTVILTPTHFSNLDSVLIGWALYELGLPPFCYGAGLNLFSNPVFGFFMNNLGAYKVDRRKKHILYKETLKNYSMIILERGCHSLFFPGGGRSRSGGLEKKLKLGLLSTAIDAYIENLLKNKPQPKIFIVPCVTSYHFVLEASTLIEDYLSEQGKHRYIIDDDESSEPKEILQFLYKFIQASSSIYINFGQPLDPFGNLVNEEGESVSPQGHVLAIENFVRSNHKVCHSLQRDQEYTKLLGERLIKRLRIENIALTSHFVAYTYFEYLREKYSQNDLFKLFRLSEEETQVSFNDYAEFAEPLLNKLHELHESNQIKLEPALRSKELNNILASAERNMGVYHSKRALKTQQVKNEKFLFSEDLKLLFYYHNRMEGYQLARQ